jgi:hypothetical protein
MKVGYGELDYPDGNGSQAFLRNNFLRTIEEQNQTVLKDLYEILPTPELRDEFSEHKPEILILLKQNETEITVSHIAGVCPHCRQPLQVFTYTLDDEAWIQCPTKPENRNG